jgi:NAD(P)-dependent dehydrogenase (short-subunit alcohol dehydrogenase family)
MLVARVTGPVMALTGGPAYAALKAGKVGRARALADDSASHGVTVDAFAPGWNQTGSQARFEHE